MIYGIPGQTLESWKDDVRQAIDLGIDHLSCYALSFESGTPLGGELARGAVSEMPEAGQEACYRAAIELAAAAGLEHYEISNFARPGSRCRHNLTYWRNETYLGLGPAAASYIGGSRRTNRPDLGAYIEALEQHRPPPADAESLPIGGRMAETAMLGMRLIEGLDRAASRTASPLTCSTHFRIPPAATPIRARSPSRPPTSASRKGLFSPATPSSPTSSRKDPCSPVDAKVAPAL